MSSSAEQPFVATPPGDHDAVARLAARAATHWGLPAPVPMRTGMSALLRCGDDVVLRICRPTADPAAAVELADRLQRAGLRVPRFARRDVVVDGHLAAFAMVREVEHGEPDWAEVGAMVARLHQADPAIAGRYPAPRCWSFPWWDFDALLADVDDLLDPAARSGLVDAIERGRDWRWRDQQLVVCHGDVHPGNVIPTATGTVLIDWDLLCTGPRGWDHGPLATWTHRWGGAPGIYESFAAGYGRDLRDDPATAAIAELRLVAATLMRVRAGRSDPAAAAEAARRLRFWRGDAEAPAWQAM